MHLFSFAVALLLGASTPTESPESLIIGRTLAFRPMDAPRIRCVYRRVLSICLRDLKVQLQRTSLGRIGGQVAYVIGDEGESKPQFWAYKDSFLPARVRFPDAQGTPWDVQFLDFSSPITGDWFPRNLELRQQGRATPPLHRAAQRSARLFSRSSFLNAAGEI